MKTFIRIAVLTAVIGSLSLATIAPVLAQAEPKPPRFDELCQRIKNRLNVRIGNISSSRDENISVYESLNKRFEKVITAAEKKQYDTTSMKTALEESRAAIAAYDSTGKAYSNQLTSTANDACTGETNYKTAIETSRTNLKTARDAGLATRSVFQYSVIPELRAYKVWLNEQANTGTSETEATETTEIPTTGEAL